MTRSTIDSRYYYMDGYLWFNNGKKQYLLCNEFFVVGKAGNNAGEPLYILKYQEKHFALPWAEIGSNTGRKILLKYIPEYPATKRGEQLLIEFIRKHHSHVEHWELADVAGWHENIYILPDGTMLGNVQKTLFTHAAPYRSAYTPKGTLQEWQRQIGRYVSGNSRLSLFVGAAFAAPLLRYFDIEGGILHVYGESSSGKSTAQKVALSVWGHGKNAGYSWNATGYALINVAASRNDGLLSLDEIGEDDKNTVESCAYTIANGQGRLQGSKEGGNQPETRFRVLAISSGEITLAAHFSKRGKRIMAGQMARCPSIPHRLENPHDFPDFRSFAEHLNKAAVNYYGTAGREFINSLLHDSLAIEKAKQHYIDFLNICHERFELASQHARATKLFAACAAGLSLAAEWEVMRMSAEEAKQAVFSAFSDWIVLQPKGNTEENQIAENAIDLFPTLLNKFINIDDTSRLEFNREFVGVVSKATDGRGNFYDVFPAKFKELFCIHGDDKRNIDHVTDVLGNKMGWLQRPNNGRWQCVRRMNGELIRVYRFLNASPPEYQSED